MTPSEYAESCNGNNWEVGNKSYSVCIEIPTSCGTATIGSMGGIKLKAFDYEDCRKKIKLTYPECKIYYIFEE